MLDTYPGYAMIPAQDLDRARAWYEEKLGLKPSEERPEGLWYEAAGTKAFMLFTSTGQASGTHTQFGWDVDDLEGAIQQLKSNGVVFEEYDLPGFKTVNSIAEIEDERAAFFKDSEGNLLAVGQRPN